MAKRASEPDSTDSDSDDDEPYVRICTPRSRKAGKVCVMLSECRYNIVKFTIQYLDYRDCDRLDHCRFIWTDSPPSFVLLDKLRNYQTISRFPLMNEMCKKGPFFQNINRMRLTFPSDFRFVPRTWVLPQDLAELNEEFALAQPSDRPRTYIVKPTAGSQGQGIYLVQRQEDIKTSAEVVQRYVDRPFLIDGLKFDLRIYVLVTSVAPLRIWLGREGLARFCTKRYEGRVTRENMGNAFMHLTNYAVNKNSKEFVANDDATADDRGSKRSLSSVTRLLKKKGYDVEKMWGEIVGVIVKSMLAIHPTLLNAYALHASPPIDLVLPSSSSTSQSPDSHSQTNTSSSLSSSSSTQQSYPSNPHALYSHPSQCCHIIGFDVMLDYSLRPWVVEINHSPSLVSDSPLDQKIKFLVVSSALRLLRTLEEYERGRIRRSEKRRIKNAEKEKKQKEEEEIRKVAYELNNLSSTTRVDSTQTDDHSEKPKEEEEKLVVGKKPDSKGTQREEKEEEEEEEEEEPTQSVEGFYRLIYSESLPRFTSLHPGITEMGLFNSTIIHHSFYQGCGVRGPAGEVMISRVAPSSTPAFSRFFRLHADEDLAAELRPPAGRPTRKNSVIGRSSSVGRMGGSSGYGSGGYNNSSGYSRYGRTQSTPRSTRSSLQPFMRAALGERGGGSYGTRGGGRLPGNSRQQNGTNPSTRNNSDAPAAPVDPALSARQSLIRSVCATQIRVPVMGCSKFCQFGRAAGFVDGKVITAADLDLLYRDVTRHSQPSPAAASRNTTSRYTSSRAGTTSSYSRSTSRSRFRSGTSYGNQNTGGGGAGGGLATMGYGEFCTALMNLATRRYPEMSHFDAMKALIQQLEDKFVLDHPLIAQRSQKP